MDFFDVLKSRHSIRKYQPGSIEGPKLDAILHAANGAPSAVNRQSYEIYVARTPEARAAVAAATFNQGFLGLAPVVLVFCTHAARSVNELGEQGARQFSVQDASIACTFAMLAATAQGLASCWVGAFDPEALRRAIGAPDAVVPMAILPIGYAAEPPELTTRRPIGELVHEFERPAAPGA